MNIAIYQIQQNPDVCRDFLRYSVCALAAVPVVICGVVAADVVPVVRDVVRVSPVVGAVVFCVVAVVPTVEVGACVPVIASACVPVVACVGGGEVVACVVVSRKCSRQ